MDAIQVWKAWVEKKFRDKRLPLRFQLELFSFRMNLLNITKETPKSYIDAYIERGKFLYCVYEMEYMK